MEMALLHGTIKLDWSSINAIVSTLERLKVETISGQEAFLALDTEVLAINVVEDACSANSRSGVCGVVMSLLAPRRDVVWGGGNVVLLFGGHC